MDAAPTRPEEEWKMPSHDPTATVAPLAHEDPTRSEPRPAARQDPPDSTLVARIVEHHHAYERRALPYIVDLLAKVAGSHRGRNAKLAVLCEAGQELAEALEAQLEEEERELFPALLGCGRAAAAVRSGLDRMRRHHRALELLLARIRWLADDFAVPAWGGRAYQVLMEELEALEEDVLEHMHLESAVLGARAS